LGHATDTLSFPAEVAFSRDHGCTPARRQMSYQFLFVMALFLLSAGTATWRTFASSQESPLPTESDLSRNPALAPDWAKRVMAHDPEVRTTAEAALVQGAGRSMPLLRRFLNSHNGDLHLKTSEIVRSIGPVAIPVLTDMLRDDRASIRRSAVDVLIDLAPDTERIQPPLRRALGDPDSLVARDAAHALGALGKKAGPSVPALVH
jgi:HEAT repeat protein